MAGRIKATPEQMRGTAAKFGKEATNLGQSMSRMKQLVNSLDSMWEGDATKAYKERYAKLEKSFQNAMELMEELDKNLKASAKIIEETDKKIASQLR